MYKFLVYVFVLVYSFSYSIYCILILQAELLGINKPIHIPALQIVY